MSAIDQTDRLAATARTPLGQAGPAIPTSEHLRFQLDHAMARDAVHTELDVARLLQSIAQRGWDGLAVRSAVAAAKGTRKTYLLRPDLGRKLSSESADILDGVASTVSPPDLVFALSDGLSALAVERHALPLLDSLLPLLGTDVTVGPFCVVSQGRVAVGDEIGDRLRAKLMVMLIGERPGLSSPDSLGAYITWSPRVGRTDAERNCISNIRTDGLQYAEAAERIAFYLRETHRLQISGIALKDPDLPRILR